MLALCSGDLSFILTPGTSYRVNYSSTYTRQNGCVLSGDFFKLTNLQEQRVCVKLYFKWGKTFTETFQMFLQVYGEDCLTRTQCHEWYLRFKSGRTSIEKDPKSGRPSTSMDDDHVQKVLAVIRQICRVTVCEVAEEVGICESDFERKTEDALCCRKICSVFDDSSLLIHEFLTKHETTVVPQPPCSPDLAPMDILLFSKWKTQQIAAFRRWRRWKKFDTRLSHHSAKHVYYYQHYRAVCIRVICLTDPEPNVFVVGLKNVQ